MLMQYILYLLITISARKPVPEPVNYCIPNYADIMVFQATYEGHYAFRSVNNFGADLSNYILEADIYIMILLVYGNSRYY